MDKESIFIAIKQFLDESNLEYFTKLTPNGYSLFSPGIRIENSLKFVSQVIEISKMHITISAYCPMCVSPSRIDEVAKFLALANYDLLLGNFELNTERGDIHYRHFVDCECFLALPVTILRRCCPIPLLMLRQYGDAIVAVATGITSAETAFAQVGSLES